eukprot:CAMPEP_0183824366 /NCGR_PEP_ID=MMETSP0807_2-20130328/536_1 /TAXON_ID=88271 /ORGANISM="Picocystis salinarum, Strain CCMP1897" /LENGTH=47 /DNA_ID= /DNA_START= /DNA_END= /DNA_ORIENTATION=
MKIAMLEEHNAVFDVAALLLGLCDGADLYRRHKKLNFDTMYGLEERN